MADGDLAFFYHSNIEPVGIAGTMRIVGDAYPDPTQFDSASEYFDPKAPADGSRWILRNVVFVEKYLRVVGLSELRQLESLSDMFVLRKGQRLSVMPVTEAEWNTINALPGLRN